jgi:glucosyl-3-phosphoglycerate phosphatase
LTRLVVVRHGRTGDNASGRIQGQVDAKLDEVGRAQARAAAVRLAELAPAAIVASDLSRAADTAAELATRTGLPVRYDPRLRERSFGRWQGLLNAEVAERFPEAYARWQAGQPVDGFDIEAVDEVAKRAAAAFEDAAELAPAGTVVVFGHGAAARYGMAVLLGWPTQLVRTLRPLGNCRWIDLSRDPLRGWQLAGYNVG